MKYLNRSEIKGQKFKDRRTNFKFQISNFKSYMRWKILSSEYLFKDTWFSVRKDRCETPDGKIVDPYYVYEFPTWVTALPRY
jgi:hypothetical protein